QCLYLCSTRKNHDVRDASIKLYLFAYLDFDTAFFHTTDGDNQRRPRKILESNTNTTKRNPAQPSFIQPTETTQNTGKQYEHHKAKPSTAFFYTTDRDHAKYWKANEHHKAKPSKPSFIQPTETTQNTGSKQTPQNETQPKAPEKQNAKSRANVEKT